MTRILHWSDNHGHFPKLKGCFDFVVNSGDFLPDMFDPDPRSNMTKNQMQTMWLEDHLEDLKNQLQDKTLLFTLGNHDFINPYEMEWMLNSNGIKAYCLHDKVFSYHGLNFYGFPWVPAINGSYNYETSEAQMLEKIDEMFEVLNETYVDIIVAHCMPANILDLDFFQNKRFGNPAMTSALNYKINNDMMPQIFMGGHIHSSCGLTSINGVLYSNMATSQTIIEV